MAISKLNPIEGGIPKGNTNNRSVQFPSPVIGDVYYNGTLEILEIYNGTTWVAVSAPPATPSIATPTDVSTADAYTSTAGKLSVVFTPGSGGGTPNQYNAYTTAGGYSGFSATSTVVISGLTPGTAYTVYGNAQNNFGTTVNTANAAAVTPTTIPQTPTIGTATASGVANEITVTWTNGATGGKALSAITITPYLNGTTAETPRTAATTSSTSYTFTQGQLTLGASYTFKVKATNANGVSLESSASNSATMPNNVIIDYMVLAGGGGGGSCGGGGGAGGLRSSVTATGGSGSLESALVLTKGVNYTVSVGAGGAGAGSGSLAAGSSGVDSVFATVTSLGGGWGQGNSGAAAGTGGSGGGAGSSGSNGVKGNGTANQGFDGGAASGGNPYPSGGGGGASAVGNNGSGSTAGNGGNGRAVSITGTSVIYGGGGGGGLQNNGTPGTGGSGGGGNGTGTSSGATSGSTNLGGGGGGGGYQPSAGAGGAGGSGVVILRWLTSSASITVGAGLTADSTGTDGSYSYKRFTAGSGNVSFA